MPYGVKKLEVREDMSSSSHRNRWSERHLQNETKREAGIINFTVNFFSCYLDRSGRSIRERAKLMTKIRGVLAYEGWGC